MTNGERARTTRCTVLDSPPAQTSPCIGSRAARRAPASPSKTEGASGPMTVNAHEKEVHRMSNLLWTIFGIIGIIVVIGWFLGRV
jgi:hypothetical protein